MKIKMKKINNYVEMQVLENNFIAFVSFIHHQSKEEVEIRDIEIEPPYQTEEVRDYILKEILKYSNKVNAKRIIHYCHGMGIGLSAYDEMNWLLDNGFVYSHSLFDITPCVILDLKRYS